MDNKIIKEIDSWNCKIFLGNEKLKEKQYDEKINFHQKKQYVSKLLKANLLNKNVFILLLILCKGIVANSINNQKLSNDNLVGIAPFFTSNIQNKVIFYNTTGTVINCPVGGEPKPSVTWFVIGQRNNILNNDAIYRYTPKMKFLQHWSADNQYLHFHQNINIKNTNIVNSILESNTELSLVQDLHSLLYVRNDGALVFPPFYTNDLQPSVHNRKYRCLAINEHGAILSNEIQTKALIYQPFEVKVYDEFVFRDNVGVLRCQVPAFILDYVTFNCWIRNDGLIIKKSSNKDLNSRYLFFDTGELHLKQIVKEDEKYSYRCEITDQLIGQTIISSSSGHFVFTESSNSMAPRFIHRKTNVRSIVGSTIYLPCAVQASPKAEITWFNETSSSLSSNLNNLDLGRSKIFSDGSLVLTNLAIFDSGTYRCLATNRIQQEAALVQLTVYESLSVSINGGDRQVKSSSIGASLLLNCTIKGQPINHLFWYRNGIRINPGRSLTTTTNLISDTDLIHEPSSTLLANKFKLIDGTSLLINSIDTTDDGLYQCFVKRDLDQAQASIRVIIISKHPVLVKTPSNVSVEQGGRVSLHCAAQGTPLPQILWTSYGETLQEKMNIRIGDFVSADGSVHSFVNLTQLSAQDGGLYTCSAKNFLGSTSISSYVSVKSVPPYVKFMNNITALASASFSLQCPYSAYGPVTIFWYKGKRRLPLNRRQTVFSNGTLFIENLFREEDEGEYKCIVQDEKNNFAERSVFVRILIKPSIMPFSFVPNLQEGMRASVTCTVTTGDPPVKLSWLLNGRLLQNEIDQSNAVSNRNTELNTDDQLSSNKYTQTISVKDVYIESVDEFISTLIFRPLRQDHSGQYSCVATNKAAKVNYTVTLSVDAPPKWMIEPTDQTGIVGNSILIHCQASGKPEPRVLWKKLSFSNSYLNQNDAEKKSKELELSSNSNYKTLISGSRVQTLVNGTLYILEAVKEDSGVYMCEASNGIGTTLSTVVHLTIHTPAHFKERYQQIKALRNDSLHLNCIAYGEFPLKLTWAKENKGAVTSEHSSIISSSNERLNEISNARVVEELVDDRLTSKLIINSVQKEHSGLYFCLTSNKYANDERHIELLVQDIPDTIESLKIVKVSSKFFQISWSSPFDGNSHIKRYILEYKTNQDNWQTAKELILETTRVETFVRNLNPVTEYNIRIAAVNDVGKSKWSNVVTITTEEEVPETAPTYVHVTATGSRRLKIFWKSGKASKNSSITGYYIGYKVLNSPSFIFKTIKLSNLNKEDIETEKTNFKFSHELTNLEKQTKYVIVVQAFNMKGAGPLSTETVCSTLEFDAPAAPEIELENVQYNSVVISWQQTDIDNPVFGYTIKFKRKITLNNNVPINDFATISNENQKNKTSNDFDTNNQIDKNLEETIDSSWLETQIINTEQTKFTINNLKCGSFYLIKICAFNSMGRGSDSEVLQVKTKGSKPQIPDKEQLFILNSSYLQLNLFVFSNFEHVEHCPIEYLNIKYKKSNDDSWANWLLSNQDQYIVRQDKNSVNAIKNNLVLDSNNALPASINDANSNLVSGSNNEFFTYHHNKNNLMNFPETCVINNLSPATWFNVWITVRNSAGTTDAIYKVATLTENGEFLQQQSNSTKAILWMPFLGSISLLSILVLTAVIILYLHHRSNTVAIQYSTASIEPKSNECLALGQLSIDKNYINSNATYVDSCSNFATSSCSTGIHVNAYQSPNCNDLNPNITNNLLIKNPNTYSNNYTTCTNLMNIGPGSNHNLVDDVYLPSPYAATRIHSNLENETSLKLDHQQQLLLEKKSFSNIYDIPQQQINQHNLNQLNQQHLKQQQSNHHLNKQNQNRNNSVSIGELAPFIDPFNEKQEDLSQLYSTSTKNRRAISQVDLLWNSQSNTYQQQVQSNNCQKTLSTFRK